MYMIFYINHIFLSIFIFYLLILFSVSACSSSADQEMNNVFQQVKSMVNDEEIRNIEIIKNMVSDDGYKMGDLIENALASPTYEFYDPAEDGNVYITIKGNVKYKNVPVAVTLQYKKVGDERYEFYTMTYNDIPQNKLETLAFFS